MNPFSFMCQAVQQTVDLLLPPPDYQRIVKSKQIEFPGVDARDALLETSIMAGCRILARTPQDKAIVRQGWHVGRTPGSDCPEPKLHVHVDLWYKGRMQVEKKVIYPMGLQLGERLSEQELAEYGHAVRLVLASAPQATLYPMMHELLVGPGRIDLLARRVVRHYIEVVVDNKILQPLTADEARSFAAATASEALQVPGAYPLTIVGQPTADDVSPFAGRQDLNRSREVLADAQNSSMSATHLSRELDVLRRKVRNGGANANARLQAKEAGRPPPEVLVEREATFKRVHPGRSIHASELFPPFTTASTSLDGLVPPYVTTRGIFINRRTKLAVAKPQSFYGSMKQSIDGIGLGDDNLTMKAKELREQWDAEQQEQWEVDQQIYREEAAALGDASREHVKTVAGPTERGESTCIAYEEFDWGSEIADYKAWSAEKRDPVKEMLRVRNEQMKDQGGTK